MLTHKTHTVEADFFARQFFSRSASARGSRSPRVGKLKH